MANRFPSNAGRLLALEKKMASGIESVGASVPVTMTTREELDAAAGAFRGAESDFAGKRRALKDAYGNFKPAAEAVFGFLHAARPVFVSSFGYGWSADWAAVGFVNHSTALPDRIVDRFGLASAMIDFLTDHPAYEVEKTGVTAANGAALLAHALEMEGAVTTAKRGLKQAKATRAPLRRALLGAMRALMKNLSAKLPRDDPRWLAFGLNMPATKTTPSRPTGLTAQMDPTSTGVILMCDAQPLVERFRFRGRKAGSGLPFQLLARAPSPLARTKPIAPGTTMEFIVQAVNGDAQSVPSAPILFTLPARAAPPLARPKSIAASNGDASESGHAAGVEGQVLFLSPGNA